MVMVLVVPVEELTAEAPGTFDATKTAGESGAGPAQTPAVSPGGGEASITNKLARATAPAIFLKND